MPGKSRHGKGKHPHRSKKSKAIKRQASTYLQQQATAEAPEHAAPVRTEPAPKAASPAVTTPRYPYVAGELKRIGILAGIIIVILIVLSIVL